MALAVATVVAALVWGAKVGIGDPPVAPRAEDAAVVGPGTVPRRSAVASDATAAAPGAPAPPPGASAPPVEPPPPPALGSGEAPRLRADDNGHLVVDTTTRDELEKLLALNGRAESLALLGSLESSLPPVAYREAVNAYYALQNYLTALPQVITPSQPATDEQQLALQLDALHALRVQMLGATTAAAYFNEEEAFSRQTIAWMLANPMPGATLAEKAQRAQEAVAKTP